MTTKTTQTTMTTTYSGYTTTYSNGSLKTFPPSTAIITKDVVVTEPVTSTVRSNSTAAFLHEFNSHGLWGVTMSLVTVTATIVFMLFL